MKPWIEHARTATPDGEELCLRERDSEFVIEIDGGAMLMSNRVHGSEMEQADLACSNLPKARPHVLVGGLGMGFTVRATLDLLPKDGIVTVSELLPAIVEWNRGILSPFAGHPLRDPRVRVDQNDVAKTIRSNPKTFDAILLDVDNGPEPFTATHNAALYGDAGLQAARKALKPGGTYAVWSAFGDHKFEQRLRANGFQARSERVRACKGRGSRHTVFLGVKK